MDCANCGKHLGRFDKSMPIVLNETTIARHVKCQSCNHVNRLIYYFSLITITYLDKKE